MLTKASSVIKVSLKAVLWELSHNKAFNDTGLQSANNFTSCSMIVKLCYGKSHRISMTNFLLCFNQNISVGSHPIKLFSKCIARNYYNYI